ncbi:unnamed protein product [Phytophthora fragariaefolia]|uniref:Unnamed protein product n=1 Tax=Phytophthora fragariaefolia TaxID=1490495 RepID=A0A9W6YEZ0_9STRA|nr:unnamed protein product [Phytophthora fragariaefolia]
MPTDAQVAFTTGWRIECAVSTIKAWKASVKDGHTKTRLRTWEEKINLQLSRRGKLKCLDNANDWKWVRQARIGKDQMMRLCDPINRAEGSQHLLVAKVFDAEIATLLVTVIDNPLDQKQPPELYGRLQQLRETEGDENGKNLKQNHSLCSQDFRVLSQNVMGFKTQTREKWLDYWRGLPKRNRPTVIMLQETHTQTQEEVRSLQQAWQQRRPWQDHLWSNRQIGIEIAGHHILNLYAPTQTHEQNIYFKTLSKWRFHEHPNVIIGGDFNCVEVPMLDRRSAGGRQTENEALITLVTRYQFTDARNLIGYAEEDLDLEELDHYTLWRGDSASRIDRFYVAKPLNAKVQWLSVNLPGVHSDHQEVIRQCRAANVEEIRERTLLRVGLDLEEKMDKVRWRFWRTAIWERDQRVTAISAPPGQTYPKHLSIAQRITNTWEPLFNKSHRHIPTTELGTAIDKFVRIPPDRKVSQGNNELLMAEIEEAELTQAVRSLQRHNVAGPDGLNNDFCKALPEEVVSALVDVCNSMLKGAPPPKSFLEGTVIPLRKKGDSADAMDYRPIMLLLTSYKIHEGDCN